MTSRYLRFVAIPLAAALLLGRPDCAYACSCAPVEPPAVELQRAAAVFAGRVVHVDVPPAVGGVISSADPVRVTFGVTEVWKGPVEASIQIVTARDGASCGYEFVPGAEYLVYARTVNGELYAGLCSRILEASSPQDRAALGQGEVPLQPPPEEMPEPDELGSGLTSALLLGMAAVLAAAWLYSRRGGQR